MPPLGTLPSYRVLQHPCPSPSSHEGQLLLLHPAAEVLWHDTTPTTLAVYIRWGMQSLYLVSMYAPPLTSPHCARLREAGLDPVESSALVDLRAVLASLPCASAPVVAMGDLNARTAAAVPDLAGHPPRHTVDPTLNTRGRALLRLATDVGVFIATGTFAASHSATSLGSCPHPLPTSIVDYTLASPAAYSLV